MIHADYFSNFLKQTVNLSEFNLEVLEGRVEAIYKALKADSDLGPRILRKIPQGSWAQETIISPQKGKPFDADFLLEMSEQEEWAQDPAQYIHAVYRAIHQHSVYGKMPHNRKCRCVYLEYAENKMHVDVVPYVVLSDGRQVIVNRDANDWETTNPDGFTQWMMTQDKIAQRNLRKVIRLVKFLRDHKGSFTGTKSILITTLLGERVEEWKKIADPGYYKDVPTALLHLVSDLDVWLQANPVKPSISDPSNRSVNFDHRWTQETYAYFRARIHVHAAEIEDAYFETDEDASVAKWQAIFGDKFQAPPTSTTAGKFGAAAVGVGAANGAEQASSAGRSGRAG
jgi:hypothetical protein